ncbi:Small heat shock protein [Croceitalea dokdonensis DOKDO 023]|uniref:Small heat shock protein n=1 Tax=Croceitalea dokdonensis DOKDO 023 TaxID=1300341 RepID=A0A0P7B111_9FLAO|nr:Hsp20/alpha crystallin family protein [Croceitalea dokdonensis]KPM31629.1 Small heat shock protein [Croceitalea dokdonensis DOKDO 023]
MSLVKANHTIFPSLMNNLLYPDWFGGLENTQASVPAVNIVENENDFRLAFAVPGFTKEDFNIELDNETLTVSSIKKEEKEKEENVHFTRREFSYQSFKRAFTLPESVDGGKINATYENGILRLVLPKKEEALPKPKRFIEIA